MTKYFITQLLLLLVFNIVSGSTKLKELIPTYKNTVVKIESSEGKFKGSGFFINTDGQLLTCAHVLKDSVGYYDSIYVRNYAQVTFSSQNRIDNKDVRLLCDVTFVDSEKDFAIISVRKDIYTYDRFPYNHLGNSNSIYEGQDVIVCAFIPDQFAKPKAFVAKGIVSTVRDSAYSNYLNSYLDLIQMDLNIAKGTSGGPIIDIVNDKIIAIQGQGILGRDWKTPYAIGYTIDQYLPILDSLGIPYDIR